MISLKFVLVVAALLLQLVSATTDNPTISLGNMKKLFDSVKPYADLSNAYHSAKGLSLLGESVSAQAQELCQLAKTKVDKNNLESIFYATSLASLAGNCQLTTADFQTALSSGASSQNVADIYHYVFSAVNLKAPIDSAKVSKNVVDGLKADSSILNQAYALHIATQLKDQEKTFFAYADDIIEQADEVDGKFLQYEGGVGTTSLVLDGIFLLADKVKHLPTKLDHARLTKFVNYLTSKRQATNLKSAFFLLRASLRLADNQHAVPVVLNRVSSVNVLPTQATLVISLTDMLGRPVKNAQFSAVEAESAKSQSKADGGAALFTSKRAFTKSKDQQNQWEIKLIDSGSAVADFYTVVVNAKADKRFFLLQKQVEVKVTTVVDLVDIQVAVADRDQTVPKYTKLQDNTKLKERLEADQQSKFYLKFAVKEKTKGALIEAHQAFVRFVAANTGRDIVFLAQASLGSNQYTAEVDFSNNAKAFRYSSGVYTVELIVSDSLIENPTTVKLADVRIQFHGGEEASQQQDKTVQFQPKPEIKHMFRPPEPTPPKVVSSTFALLCILPTALMFILWLKIGFNTSKFQFSLSAIVFHVSLAAIFVLFYFYWVKFNMFQTLRYLAIIGGVTFVAGNYLLRGLAETSSKEKKAN